MSKYFFSLLKPEGKYGWPDKKVFLSIRPQARPKYALLLVVPVLEFVYGGKRYALSARDSG